MSIYDRIYNLCKSKSITGKELGEKLGLKKSPLTDWKNAKSKPTIDQIIMMCEIFATSTNYLLLGNEYEGLTEDEENLIKAYREADNRTREIVRLCLEPYMTKEKSYNLMNG